MTPEELIELARRSEAQSIQRVLYVVAAICEALNDSPVLVGGAASNLYTGDYKETDIDLVGYIGAAQRARLVPLGFVDPGPGNRHISLDLGNETLLVEFPKPPLAAEREPDSIRVADGVTVRVISLEDLILDRVRQITGGDAVERDAALALCIAAFPRVDWPWVEEQVTKEETDVPGMQAAFDNLMRRVRRALRRMPRKHERENP